MHIQIQNQHTLDASGLQQSSCRYGLLSHLSAFATACSAHGHPTYKVCYHIIDDTEARPCVRVRMMSSPSSVAAEATLERQLRGQKCAYSPEPYRLTQQAQHCL